MSRRLEIAFNATQVRLNTGATVLVRGEITAEPGDIVLVRGPNGCGKTTFLMVLHSVLDQAERGSVLELDWSSVVVASNDHKAAHVFQEPRDNFICRSSADEIILPLLHETVTAQAGVDRLSELVDAADIHSANIFAKKIDNLSSGEQQKLAICAALAPEPTVMLWDEALARIDNPSAERIVALLASAQRDTILFASTHRLQRYAELFASRVSSVVTIERQDGELWIRQEFLSEAHRTTLQDQKCKVNIAARKLWNDHVGEVFQDPVKRLFSNGFRVFSGGGDEHVVIENLEINAGLNRLVSNRRIAVCGGVNFVVGRNGSGKTLLLRLLAGQIPVNPLLGRSSSLHASLELTSRIGALRALRSNARSIYLSGEPFRWITEETVEAELRRFHNEEAFGARSLVLSKLGIATSMNPEYLSYGQRKIISLLSLPENLDIVCLDEPFADLGEGLMTITEEHVRDMVESKKWTSVVVSQSSDVSLKDAQ